MSVEAYLATLIAVETAKATDVPTTEDKAKVFENELRKRGYEVKPKSTWGQDQSGRW